MLKEGLEPLPLQVGTCPPFPEAHLAHLAICLAAGVLPQDSNSLFPGPLLLSAWEFLLLTFSVQAG